MIRIDAQTVKAAAASRWPEILTTIGGIAPELLDGQHHECPKCGGTNRFRLIDAEAGAVLCNQCFNRENGDGFAALRWVTGQTFPEVLTATADYLGLRVNGSSNGQVEIVAHVCRLKGMPEASFRAFGGHAAERVGRKGSLPVARLPVSNPEGEPHSYCDFPRDGGKGLLKAGKGSSGIMGEMHDDKIVKPKPGDTVFIVEGKDAIALHGLGFKAYALPGCKLKREFASWFRGVHVRLVPHRDAAGQAMAEQIARLLVGVAASVRIAALPLEFTETAGGDVRDVLKLPDGERLVRECIEQAAEWKPEGTSNAESGIACKPAPLKLPSGRTDAANAARFVSWYGDEVLWCEPFGKFLAWDGCRWKLDDVRRVDELAKQIGRGIWAELAADAGDGPTKDMLAHAKMSNSARGLRNMLELVRCEVAELPEVFDASPWLLNCPNGTLDLRTGKMRSHQRGDRLTKLCPTSYKPDAPAQTWLRFLGEILPDDVVGFLRRLLGYCLTGLTTEHVLPIFHGHGANGKSTLLDAVQATIGDDYAAPAAADLLLAKKGNSHPTEVADLHGRRLVTCIETDEGRRLAEGLVKQLTGGDRLKARRMREDFWAFTATHKLILACNHKPEVRGTDHAIWRRLRLVPFAETITNPDTSMGEKLKDESEGILAWLVAGCHEWQRVGLAEPDAVLVATNAYRSEQDTLAGFLDECCILGSSQFNASAGALFDAFRDFGGALSQRRFGEALKERGFERRRYTTGPNKDRYGWWGIGLTIGDATEF